MRRLYFWFVVLIGFVGVESATFAGSSASHDVIVVATEGDYPPFNYMKNGKVEGFDVDIMKEICHRSRVRCEFRAPVVFSELLPGLTSGQWDVTIAGMGITSVREQTYDFAGPYYKASKFFFGKKGLIINTIPNDLAGMRIGVQSGTVRVDYMSYLQKKLNDINGRSFTVVLYDNDTDMDAALKGSQLDYVIKDTGALDAIANDPSFSKFAAIGPELTGQDGGHLFGRGDGIGLRKGDKRQYLFNQALQSMFYDCTYARIEAKHFQSKNVLVPAHCRRH